MSDSPCFSVAARDSSQSGCSPEMTRKHSTSGSTEAGASITSAVPSICAQGPFQSSLSTTTATFGFRGRSRVLARAGQGETTIRPCPSTPRVSGDACGEPPARAVSSRAPCRGRTKSGNSARSRRVSVAREGDIPAPCAGSCRERVRRPVRLPGGPDRPPGRALRPDRRARPSLTGTRHAARGTRHAAPGTPARGTRHSGTRLSAGLMAFSPAGRSPAPPGCPSRP